MYDVCAVVVSRGSDSYQLQTCIESLRAHTGHVDLEVIVVDIGSGWTSNYVEQHLPGVGALHCPERSRGYGFNRALEVTSARYAVFLASEVELLEGTLSELSSALDSFSNIAVTGVRQVRADDSLAPSIGRFPSALHMFAEATGLATLPGTRRFLGEQMFSPHGYKLPRTCDWVSSSLMFVRTAALDGVGWFDERLLGSEDADMCWRLQRFGWEVVYLPCMTVRNHQHDQLENARREARAAYARMQFARKHFPDAATEYRFALGLRYALRVGLYSLRGRYASRRRQAARTALETVRKGRPPLGELPIA